MVLTSNVLQNKYGIKGRKLILARTDGAIMCEILDNGKMQIANEEYTDKCKRVLNVLNIINND